MENINKRNWYNLNGLENESLTAFSKDDGQITILINDFLNNYTPEG